MALVPAIAALTAIGATALWPLRRTRTARVILAGTLLVTATWAWVLLDRSPGWFPWLRVVIGGAAAVAASTILVGPAVRAVIAGLGGPLAYSIDTGATAHGGSIPTAGPTVAGSSGGPGYAPGTARGGVPGQAGGSSTSKPGGSGTGSKPGTGSVSSALSRLLQSGAAGYKWAAATISSTSAASLELGSNGVPVMAPAARAGVPDPGPRSPRGSRPTSPPRPWAT